MKKLISIATLVFFVIGTYSQSTDSTLLKADSLIGQGKFEEAIVLLQKAIAKDSSNADLFCTRGIALMELKDHKQAYESFNLALQVNGEFVEGYFHRGVFFYSIGEPQLAIMDFNDVLELSKVDTLVRAAILNRGNAHYMSGDKEKALHDFDTLISLDPARISYRNNKAATLSSLGKHKEAVKIYTEIIALDKNYVNAYINKGYEQIVLKDQKSAIKTLKKGLKLHKKNAVGWNNLGLAYLELDNLKKATKYVQKSISLNESNAYAYRNLGLIELKQGNADEACNAWRKAQKLDFKYIFGPEVDELLEKHCSGTDKK